MPRIARIAPALLLAFALVSCSKSPTRPSSGGTPDSRGTPITGENAFQTSTSLAWSQASNEVLGSAQDGGTLGGAGLAAVRVLDGDVRYIDTDPSFYPRLTPDGQSVYSDAITPDSTILRRHSLGAAAVAQIAGAPGLGAFAFALSPDGRYVAFSGPGADPFDPDSVRVLDTTNGKRVPFLPGAPVAFSPDDGTLLITPPNGGFQEVALSSGATLDVDFVIPSGASFGSVHWDNDGLHALFTYNARELWLSTIAGAQTRIYTAPETIVAPSITWSPDGGRAAFWTTGPIDGGADTAYRLYVVSLAGHSGGLVALGRSIGGAITWSHDGTQLAYLFGGRLFTNTVVAAAPGAPAR